MSKTGEFQSKIVTNDSDFASETLKAGNNNSQDISQTYQNQLENLQSNSQSHNDINKSKQEQTKLSEQKQPKQEIDLKSQKSVSSDTSLVMHMQVSDVIPDVSIPTLQADYLPISIKIPMYKTTNFMKMETQIYLIDVINPNTRASYQIQRRFSDFVDLYDSLFYLHPGHILCPFPGKNFETFIKIKLGIGVSEASERSQLIEKRMAKLQTFINFVTHHPKLQQCTQIQVFLLKNQMQYEQMRAKIENSLKQLHNLVTISYLTSLQKKSKQIWSYFRKQSQEKHVKIMLRKNDLQFCEIMEKIERMVMQTRSEVILAEKLSVVQLNFAEFVDFPTDNDTLLKMCAKHSSGREYCRNFYAFIEISIIDEFKEMEISLLEAKKILDYRNELLEAMQHASKYQLKEKVEQILSRVEQLETAFLGDWKVYEPTIKQKIEYLLLHLIKQWGNHKKCMRKIWRRK